MAVYAPETDVVPPAGPGVEAADMECPPGHHRMPDGQCMMDEDMPAEVPDAYAAGGTPWSGVLVVEATWSGDGRQFAANSLTWGDLPLPLKYQPAESPGHDGSVIVGRIDTIQRVGNQLVGTGVMDDQGEHGAEAVRLMKANMLRGVSIMADDTDEEDVEYVLPEGAEPVEDGPGVMLGGPAGKMIIHKGRIRSTTLVAEPAFAEATITLGTPETVVAAAVGPHDTATSDGPWDGPANEKRLPSPMPEATGRGFYAWIDDAQVADGQMPKTAARFGHHDVSETGDPGAANITACQTGIGVLNGGRGGTTIPEADVQGVWEHLAGHLRDAGLEPPELMAVDETVVAASWSVTIPEVWPEWWFDRPSEQPPFGALHITPQGRVFGYLSPSKVTHRAFRGTGRTVTAPRGVDYSEFQNKPCLVAGGDGHVYRINAGNVTFDCGHASPVDSRRADPNWAVQHYDNSCSIAARVRVGEDEHGTWVAGGLLHGIQADVLERMMGCALSGDWQGGKLKAALLVPVEGFPVAASARVRVREDALVATAVPLVYDAPPEPEPQVDPLADVDVLFDLVASAAGRDPDTRWAELVAATGRDVDARWRELVTELNRGEGV